MEDSNSTRMPQVLDAAHSLFRPRKFLTKTPRGPSRDFFPGTARASHGTPSCRQESQGTSLCPPRKFKADHFSHDPTEPSTQALANARGTRWNPRTKQKRAGSCGMWEFDFRTVPSQNAGPEQTSRANKEGTLVKCQGIAAP